MLEFKKVVKVSNDGIFSNLFTDDISAAKESFRKFIYRTHVGNGCFRLTPNAEPSSFARCFAIFGLHLLGEQLFLAEHAERMSADIATDLECFRCKRLEADVELAFDKPYLQLLCFSLSALSVLRKLREVPLEQHIVPLTKRDILPDLERGGCLRGVPASGNQAMFIAIINLYAQKWLNSVGPGRLDSWVDAHLRSQNRFGFWGDAKAMTHLQFQNGYHQYEIFEYLDIENPRLDCAVDAVAGLADCQGHFGPYPGGGGCYDYDAVAILASLAEKGERYRDLLTLTARTLLSEQNGDGGFCDTKYLRPLNLHNLGMIAGHVMAGSTFFVKKERARLALSLMLPRHDRICGHWSAYSREWGESDLWDSWFRMLTLARIQTTFAPSLDHQWGYIDFPGIGYVRRHNAFPKGTNTTDGKVGRE